LAKYGSNALTGLWRGLTGGGIAGAPKRTVLAQLLVHAGAGALFAAMLGVTYRMTTAPVVEASTAGLIEAGGLVAAPEQESEMSTGLIGAQDAEQQESGVKEPFSRVVEGARRSLKQARRAQKAPQTAAATAGKLPTQWHPNTIEPSTARIISASGKTR